MAIETTYTSLRENLATFLDRVTDDREILVVKRRRGQRDVAIIAADELSGLMETAYLLRSPKNAERLLGALQRAEKGEGRVETVEELRKSVGM
jgi:antitoxin YefM